MPPSGSDDVLHDVALHPVGIQPGNRGGICRLSALVAVVNSYGAIGQTTIELHIGIGRNALRHKPRLQSHGHGDRICKVYGPLSKALLI